MFEYWHYIYCDDKYISKFSDNQVIDYDQKIILNSIQYTILRIERIGKDNLRWKIIVEKE